MTATALVSPPATPEAGRLEWSGTQRLRALLRERCRRLAAPEALRQRILANLPHRARLGVE